eukprot:CAMPEP_0119561466 /NCGR_PEP_ID=MMETSP1352-20130426/17720_1 /TAXON_ID=265584 /ORGANISM="Stauroneis constricta, Strain CCMP1120" /LENGTH=56 /DNA_ID=CAMNT_0007609681 /DNA_START=31 /DNA_END=198 /DNA_ORIENTATION=-
MGMRFTSAFCTALRYTASLDVATIMTNTYARQSVRPLFCFSADAQQHPSTSAADPK